MAALRSKSLEFRRILKEEGFRALFRRYGWKLIAGLFVYYICRDLIIYVLVPFLTLKLLY